MAGVNKNEAIIQYLLQCEQIENSPLYFNFIEAKDGTTQIVTMTDETAVIQQYIDGSIRKRYLFNIVTFRSISENAIVKAGNYPNENVEDIEDVQTLIDWIAYQEEEHNYPDFGQECIVESIRTTADTPRLEGVNTEVTPPLAMYSMSIQVEYIDTSKQIWG